MIVAPEALTSLRASLVEALAANDVATAKLQAALFQVEGLIAPQNVTAHMLDYPWLGQNLATRSDEDYSNNDCGPACLAMWLTGNRRPTTIDEVSKATGLKPGYANTKPADLMLAGGKLGLQIVRALGVTLPRIKAQIDSGKPLIVLVHYGSLPIRFSATYVTGHWLLVIGYTDDAIIYNDPLAQDTRGQGVVCPNISFAKALADSYIDGNQPNQGLIQATP